LDRSVLIFDIIFLHSKQLDRTAQECRDQTATNWPECPDLDGLKGFDGSPGDNGGNAGTGGKNKSLEIGLCMSTRLNS